MNAEFILGEVVDTAGFWVVEGGGWGARVGGEGSEKSKRSFEALAAAGLDGAGAGLDAKLNDPKSSERRGSAFGAGI